MRPLLRGRLRGHRVVRAVLGHGIREIQAYGRLPDAAKDRARAVVNRKNYELLIWTGEDPRKAPGDWADRQFIVLLSKDEKDFLTSALQGAERAGEIQDFMISEYVAEEDLDDLVHELRKMGLGRFFSRKHWGPR